MSRRRAVAHRADGSIGDVDPSNIDVLLRDSDCLIWLDVEDPTEEDLALLREEFGFHELALEDALLGGQRPKVDEYEGYYFIVLYSATIKSEVHLAAREIHSFWGDNYFVTLHEGAVPEIEAAIARWTGNKDTRQHGVAYQVYALLDAIVDGYFPALDVVAERIEAIEQRVLAGDALIIREVFELRRELLNARRLLGPSRDVLNVLIRRDVPVFPQTLIPYLADVYDHTIRIIDALDVQRELLATAIESHLTVTSNRLNQTVRTLTAATIAIMVPTLIAGTYGMNFQLTPSQDWPFAFFFALGLMVASMGGLFVVFKKMGWL